MQLEIISKKPKSVLKTGKTKPKLVFVHGICVGAYIWEEYYLPYFAGHGYEVYAPSLRGHGKSGGKGGLYTWSLEDYARDLEQVIASLDGPVVVVGHSMGGAVVQEWLRSGESRNRAAGAALLASIPPWGLSYSALRMAMLYPQLYTEISRMLVMGSGNIDKDIMYEALFTEGTDKEIFHTFLKHMGDESLVASAQVQGLYQFAPMPWEKVPPVFVGGARDDRFIPDFEVRRTASYYGVQAVIAEDLAHSVMLDANWESLAGKLLSWVKAL